jgi:hypothetical protein
MNAARSRRRARVLCACGALAASVATLPAGADPSTTECTGANADGQTHRMGGQFAAARSSFQVCQAASCPAVVRRDCLQRMDELERAQPTIVFDVRDASGADVSSVTVTVDGAPFAVRLEGSAVRVDPGTHSFAFSVGGSAPVQRRLVIREGEKGRRENIVLGGEGASPAAAVPSSTTGSLAAPVQSSAAESPEGPSTRRVWGLVLGGVGVAALAEGAIMGLMSMSAANQQKTDCASDASCANRSQALADHASATTDGAVSTVSFIAGGALLVGGAILFFTAPGPSEAPKPTGLMVVPSLAPGGAAMMFRGRF